MKHPWGKLFEKALKKSKLPYENLVFEKAVELMEKGYRPEEIAEVLERLRKSLIDDTESQIVSEALLEFREDYMEPGDED